MNNSQEALDAIAAKYEAEFLSIQDELEKNDWEALKFVDRLNQSVYDRRAELIRKIPGFWLAAFQQNAITSSLIEPTDEDLLSQLEEISVKRPDDDPKGFDFVFKFRQGNGYLSNNIIEKSFRPKSVSRVNGSRNGSGGGNDQSVVLHSEPTRLVWVSDDKDLTKTSPHKLPERIVNGEGSLAGDPSDSELDEFMLGSFFNAFLLPTDLLDIFTTIGATIFPNAWDYFTGTINEDLDSDSLEDDEDDDDDEDEDDDDDGADDAEIDLEQVAGQQAKRMRMS